MNVSDIMQPNVYCTVGDMTVSELYKDLLAHEITGAPVLDDNDYLIGVVSLSDVARCVAGEDAVHCHDFYRHSRSDKREIDPAHIAETTLVKDIMTPSIHQVAIDAELEEALDVLLDEDIHRVIVTHRGHVVGIVTSGDLLRSYREFLQARGA